MDAQNAGAPLEPGTVLVASVALSDGIFDATVVLLLDVDESGALGVVLNRFSELDLARVLPGWNQLASWPQTLHDGGPVSPEGAICLATPAREGAEPAGWKRLFGQIGLVDLAIPVEQAVNEFSELRVFAGYAGWAPRQLEGEVALGMWYPVWGRQADVFDPEPLTLWRRILARQPGELGWLTTWTDTPELN